MSRQRGIFPLSNFDAQSVKAGTCSRKVHRRSLCKNHVKSWLADGVEALNSLAGFSSHVSVLNPPKAASVCMDQLEKAYFQVGKPPSNIRPEGALSELLKKSGMYC